ncbi:hypothetical protein [Streptomyces capillispiralis]|uniref:Integral membrane protein n=1 Tax=Streptomyces capillispiralis TaxID=68182 RepID=A0A561THB8_9ACTN|nr:hypothetical protein [Streptomyces capillispiralis]TWF86505.1 hypothetical protein FHX78_113473 [Streptomyces capillispiralis]GHH95227.1 hypothetical protein GCM10017779_56840 [Streptomyces capillispiralis]
MTAPHPRTVRSGRGVRILRAAVFAAVCVVLAGAGHTLASCDAVPLWTLGVGFLGVVAVAAPLAGRARSLPSIVALLAFGQTALHTLFGLGQHGAPAAAPSSALSDAALVERAARLLCGTTAAGISPAEARQVLVEARIHPGGADAHAVDAVSAAAGSPVSLLPSLPMLLGHLLAATAAGWLLRRGDLALLRLADLSTQGVGEAALVRSLRAALALVRALRAGLPGAPEEAPRVARTALLVPAAPPATALQHTVIRRGPPAVGTALALAA